MHTKIYISLQQNRHSNTTFLTPTTRLQMQSDIRFIEPDSGLMGCYGGGRGLVLCSARHIRCNSAFFTHLQLMWTALHPLNLCKILFMIVLASNPPKNEIWKSWSWSWSGNLNKTVVWIRSGLFKMCWILPDSSPEIRILYTSGGQPLLAVLPLSLFVKIDSGASTAATE